MKILGIGNAIVDVICKVDDNFLDKNNLTKGTMKLIDEEEFKRLSSSLKIEKTIAGGSVANSIVGLSQLNNEVSFLGKINDSEKKYISSLIAFSLSMGVTLKELCVHFLEYQEK